MMMRGGNFMYLRRVMAGKCGNHIPYASDIGWYELLILILPTIASYILENPSFFLAEFQRTCMSPTLSLFCHFAISSSLTYCLSTTADLECALSENRMDTKIEWESRGSE